MRSVSLQIVLMLLAVLAFGEVAPVAAQEQAREVGESVEVEDRQALARLIRQRVEALESLERQHDAEMRALGEAVAQAKARAAELEEQLTQLEATNGDLETANTRLTEAIAASEATATLQVEQLQVMVEAARSVAQQLKARISEGIPYKQANRERIVDETLAQLEKVDPVTQSQGVAQVWQALGDELRLAASRALWNEPIYLDDGARRVQAHQLRLGLVQQLFVSEDQQLSGAAGPGTDGWMLFEGEDATAARQAVDVAREQAPPRLAPVPVMVDDRTAAGGVQ